MRISLCHYQAWLNFLYFSLTPHISYKLSYSLLLAIVIFAQDLAFWALRKNLRCYFSHPS